MRSRLITITIGTPEELPTRTLAVDFYAAGDDERQIAVRLASDLRAAGWTTEVTERVDVPVDF